MAYKFQLGKAKLSGSIETAQSITSQGGLTVNGDVDLDAGVINNSELQNSSVMFNGVTVALGATGSFGTDAVTEGSSNKYYLDSRARSAVSVTDAGGDGSLSYDSATGVITYTGPSATEARAHFSAGVGLDYADGVFSVGTGEITNSMLSGAIASSKIAELNAFDTADLAENAANKYFTDARARAAVSVTDAGGDGSLTYDSGSGVFTYTGPSASEVRAHFTGGAGVDIVDGEITVDMTEIAAGLSGSVEAIVGAFVEGSDFVTFDDSTGTIGVSGAAFTGSARSVLSVTDAGGDGSLSYNSSTGVLTYTGPSASEVRAHVSAVDAGGDGSFSYDSATGAFTYTGPSASEVRAHLSAAVSGGLSYNSTNGRFAIDALAAGVGLSLASGSLNVNVDASSIEINADILRVKAAGITNAMLAGSIENAKLVNSSVTVTAGGALSGGGTVALGSTIALDVEVNGDALEIVGDQVALKSTIAGARTFSGNVVMSGDLTVNGTTTYLNTTELLVKDALIEIASGSVFAAGQGIRLGTENSLQTIAGDATVGNALSSSLPLIAPSVKASSFYGNLVGSMQLSMETKSVNATISKNVTRATANITLTLPSAPAVGQEHRVKCFVADASSPAVVVAAQSGATIEGAASLTLESYGAAVSLVWDGSDWMVF